MAHVAQHLPRGRANIQLPRRGAQALHQPPGVGFRMIGSGKARQGESQDVRAWQAQKIERIRRDDQRMGRIEAAGNADHHPLDADRAQPLHQSGDLDVVTLVAILLQTGGIGRHEGKALHPAQQAEIRLARRVEAEADAAEPIGAGGMSAAVVVERAHPHAFLTQQIEVDVGQHLLRIGREALGLGQGIAVLEDHHLAVPGNIRGALPGAGGGVDIGGEAAGGGRLRQQPAAFGTADGDRAAGKVGQHRGAGQSGLGAGRDRHPEILADFDMQHEAGHILRGEQQVVADRHCGAGKGDLTAQHVAGGDLAAFIEFPVGRQIGFRHHAEQATAMDHQRRVVDPSGMAQRCANHQDGGQLFRAGQDGADRLLHRVQQRVLQQQVLDRVPRQRQFGEHREGHALRVALARHRQHGLGIALGIGEMRARGAGGDAGEAVRVERSEVHARTLARHARQGKRRRHSRRE